MDRSNEVSAPQPVRLSKMFTDLEVEKFGGVPRGAYKPHTTERSGYGVLLQPEIDAIRKSAKTGVEKALLAACVEKLVKIGVFWPASDGIDHPRNMVFLEDTNSGLTTLEADIVKVQAESLLDGGLYNTTLIKSKDLEEILRRIKGCGVFNRQAFLHDVLELAAVRDDQIDVESMVETVTTDGSKPETEDLPPESIPTALAIDNAVLDADLAGFADKIGARLHQEWRENVWANDKKRNPDGRQPRYKETKDQPFIEAHLSISQEVRNIITGNPERIVSSPVGISPNVRVNVKRDEHGEVVRAADLKPKIIFEENIDVPYDELSETGKGANKAAGIEAAQVILAIDLMGIQQGITQECMLKALEEITRILKNYPQTAPGLESGFYNSAKERQFALAAGRHMHTAWLARNVTGNPQWDSWIPAAQRKPDFLDLDAQNQLADLQIVQVAIQLMGDSRKS